MEYTTPTMLSTRSAYTGTLENLCVRQIFWSSTRLVLCSTPTTRTNGVITSRTGVSDMSNTFCIISFSPLSTCPDLAAPDSTSLSSSSDTNGSAAILMLNTANTAFTRLVHSLPMGYTSVDMAAIGRMTTRATSAAFCTAIDFGAISQKIKVTKVKAAVHSAMLSSP